jgi:myosin heavy subunit
MSANASSDSDDGAPQPASSVPAPPASRPFEPGHSSKSVLLRSPAAVFALPVAVSALVHRFVKDLSPIRATERLRDRTTEILNDRRARNGLCAANAELLLAESAAAETAATLLSTKGLLDVALARANELESQVEDLAVIERSVDHAANSAVEKERKFIVVERELKLEQAVTAQARDKLEAASETLAQNYKMLSNLEKNIIGLQNMLQRAEDSAHNELREVRADKDQMAVRFKAVKDDLDSVLQANRKAQEIIRQSLDMDVKQMQSRLQIAVQGLDSAVAKSEDPPCLGTNAFQGRNEKFKKDLRKVELDTERLRGYITQLDEDAIVVQCLRTELDSREKALDEVRGRLAELNKNGMIERPLEFDMSSRLSVSAPFSLGTAAKPRHTVENSQLLPPASVEDHGPSPSTSIGVDIDDFEAQRFENGGDPRLVPAVSSASGKSDMSISTASPVKDHLQPPSATHRSSKHPKQRKKMTAITEILELAAKESDQRGGKTSAEAATAQALKALKADDVVQSFPSGHARGRPERLSTEI